MKIKVPTKKKGRKTPVFPSVSLTEEAYEVLVSLAAEYDISMRLLASAIITNAHENIEIEKEGNKYV